MTQENFENNNCHSYVDGNPVSGSRVEHGMTAYALTKGASEAQNPQGSVWR
jgi:hypothetical protein